jgi:predicted DNA-binding protein (MmcQ/YjbR family)
MNVERLREFLLKLPHVVEAEQWGGLLYWVGDKAIGGKTFVHVNIEAGQGHPAMFPAGAERFAELCERDGIIPAPYMARNFWVAVERWDALRDAEWQQELRAAHGLTFEKLPRKARTALALPKAELQRAIDAGRKRIAEWEAKEVVRKAAKKAKV